MQDIPAIAKAAHDGGAICMMDNTWATPLYFRPLDFGVDITIHAATKYPAGHSDVLLGTVSANAGVLGETVRVLHRAWAAVRAPTMSTRCCAACAPWACGWRITRRARSTSPAGWKASRVSRRCCTLPSKAIPATRCGSAIFPAPAASFRSCSTAAAQKQAHAFLDALQIFGLGYSWGGYESLAVNAYLGDRTIMKADTYPGPVIRLQIGLEDVEDLKADIARGLKAAAAA